jgi:signal transduction histidine kinase/ActR/RegA family two-component response regulator
VEDGGAPGGARAASAPVPAAPASPQPYSSPAGPRTLRRNLLLIVLAALMPIGLLAGALFYFLWQAQQDSRDAEAVARARTMAALVQSELDSTIHRLELLARSPLLAPESLPAFYAQLQMLLPDNEDWGNLLLISREEQLLNARLPYGSPLPRLGDLPYQQQAFNTGKPAVSDLFRARTRPIETVDVAYPVVREGKVAYLLIASLKRERFIALLAPMTRGADLSAVVDRDLRIISRSRAQETYAGQSAGGVLAPAMREAPEGVIRSRTKDGITSYTAWARVPIGWTVVASSPVEDAEATLLRSLALWFSLWLAALLTGLIMARLLYRRIDNSLASTVDAATRRARGERTAFPDTTFEELAELSGAIDSLFEQERRARDEAEAASAAKDEFLAMLGHELRNPIGAITNAAALLEKNEPGSEGDKLARRVIGRQTANLKRMIDDMLDLSRVLSGKISLESRPLDLTACARHSVETLAASGRTARHQIVTAFDTPVWIEGDPARIDQILTNLISNAVNYTPEGKRIAIGVQLAPAQVRMSEAGGVKLSPAGDALLIVEDEGVGIASATLPRIFDLFFQEEQRPDRPKSGLGLGLTLVRRLAQLHGGSVVAASPGPGQGATFTVRLPAIAPPTMTTAAATPPKPAARRVLLIEDNADARETLSTLLEIEGHTVAAAADGPAGIALIPSFGPDCAVVDVGLPGMDGYEIARAIRAAAYVAPGGKPLQLIALTGYGLPEDQKRARDAGFDAHLVKPADFDKLAQLLEKGAG